MSEYAIEMLGITKRFPGIIANDNITLQLKKGEIHALLGENGAGKSTLMSVLFFFNDTATTEIYTLSLHDALPICRLLWKRLIISLWGSVLIQR